MTERILKRRGRDRLFIIAEILDLAKDEGLPKTTIMHRANLSFARLNQYLRLLLETKLLEKVEKKGTRIYHTTGTGIEYLNSYREVTGVLGGTQDPLKTEGTISRIKSALRSVQQQVSTLEIALANWLKCPYCGKEILPDYKLCPYCGKKLPKEKTGNKIP